MRYTVLAWILTACRSVDTDECTTADLQFSAATRASSDGPDTTEFAVGDDVFAVGIVENSCGGTVRMPLTDCGLVRRVQVLDAEGAEVDAFDIDVDCMETFVDVPPNGRYEYPVVWTSTSAGTFTIALMFRDENATEATTPEFVVQ